MTEEEFPIVEPISKHEYYKDKIVYFYYQFSRTDDLESLRAEFEDFVQVLKIDKKNPEFEPYAYQIYKLVLNTRDQYTGKGEHDISYMLIDVLYEHLHTIALACIYQFVNPCYRKQAFGSWRDIKYLCEYTKNEDLINECVSITNMALLIDVININHCTNRILPSGSKMIDQNENEGMFKLPKRSHSSSSTTDEKTNIQWFTKKPIKEIRKIISNVTKWIPRENKRFGWLFDRLAIDWSKKHNVHILTKASEENYPAALRKEKMKYRKLIASINKLLDTTEIKLCANQRTMINIENIPQLAFTKYKQSLCKYVFEGPEKIFDKSFYTIQNMQRLECSLKTKKYFENKYYPEGIYEPDRQHSTYIPFSLPLNKIIKNAFDIVDKSNELQIDVLNNEWIKLSETIGQFNIKNAIPMIDMSFLSEQTDSYYTAIGLALLVAERSTFGRRILVIDNKLSWVNIEKDNTLLGMIKKINEETRSRVSTVADIITVLDEFVNYIDESKLDNTKIKELSLIYFQTRPSEDALHEKIIKCFYEGGLIGSRKLAFPCPRIVYWNLSQKMSCLPGQINSKNSIFLSGHQANLIRNLESLRTDKYEMVCEIIKDYKHPQNMD